MIHQKSIKELMSDPKVDIRQIIAHSQIIFILKNQDSIIKTIFTPQNTKLLLSYLNQEHELDIQNKNLSYKLPQSAMEIMNCQSGHLTEIIFESEKDNQVQNQSQEGEKKERLHLLNFLLNFLEYKEHYYLAGLFNKSMGSVTKRAFAPSHKYNKILCDKVFGKCSQDFDKSCLFKSLNHIYSDCMNQLIIRWLTLKGKQSNYLEHKQFFIVKILDLINLQADQKPSQNILNFRQQSLDSIINLIMLMLKSPLQPPPQKPQPVEHKNVNLMVNKNSQKQLYELMSKQKFIEQILRPIPNPRPQKLMLIKKIIQQYRIQNEQIRKMQYQYTDPHLADVISQELLMQCLGWVNSNLYAISQQIQYEGEEHKNEENTQAQIYGDQASKQITKQSKEKINKKMLVAYLDVLYEFHLLVEELRDQLTCYYEQKQKQHVGVIIKFLRLKNNIIQNLLTKILLVVLKKLNCPDFSTSLLHHGIAKVIDEESIRQHALQWAKVILQTQNERAHIFENAQQQAKWDHMSEVIAAAEQIVIGRYRFKPDRLDIHYSVDKAMQAYSNFLKVPITIQYQQKAISKRGGSEGQGQRLQNAGVGKTSLKKKMSSPPVMVGQAERQRKKIINQDKIIQDNKQDNECVMEQVLRQADIMIENIQNKQENEIGKKKDEQDNNTKDDKDKDKEQDKWQQIIISNRQSLEITSRKGEHKQQQNYQPDVLGVDSIRQGYLQYSADELMLDLD